MTASVGLKIGSVFLGRFEIHALLGQGGMGRVYKAHDGQLGRDVAIKVLLRKLAQNPVYVERFRREARAVARFSHPNIATVYDFGETDSHELYMIQEFLDGMSLRGILDKDGHLPLFKALHYAFQGAEALAAAHAKQVIHRDIKPENMIVAKSGRLTVVDFAAPREITLDKRLQQARDGSCDLTSESDLAGTPGYMSPELVLGQGFDHRSDLYALGIVLYRMLAGRSPYPVDPYDVTAVLAAHAFQAPDPLTDKDHKVPPEVWAIIEHLLAKEPSRRYQNAEEVSEDLRGAMRESLPPGDPVAQAIIKDAGKARAQKRFEAGIKSEAAKIAPRTTIPMAPATQGPSPFYQVRIDGEGEAIAPRTTVPMPVATPAPSPAYPRHELPSSQAVQESPATPAPARAGAAPTSLSPMPPPRALSASERALPAAPFAPAPSWRGQQTKPVQPLVAPSSGPARRGTRSTSSRSELPPVVSSSSPVAVARLPGAAEKAAPRLTVARAVAVGTLLGIGTIGVLALVRQVTGTPLLRPSPAAPAASVDPTPTEPPAAAPSGTEIAAPAAEPSMTATATPAKAPAASATTAPATTLPRGSGQPEMPSGSPRAKLPFGGQEPVEPGPFIVRKKPQPTSPSASPSRPTAPNRLFGAE